MGLANGVIVMSRSCPGLNFQFFDVAFTSCRLLEADQLHRLILIC
jgi:hypothetical protein